MHYIVLYPQNGDRIVTIDSVTSLHPMYGSGSVLLWRCSDTLFSSAFTDDVIFAHKPRLLDVAAQLKHSAHAALGLLAVVANALSNVGYSAYYLRVNSGRLEGIILPICYPPPGAYPLSVTWWRSLMVRTLYSWVPLSGNNLGQVVYMNVHLSPNCIISYAPKDSDVLWLGR